MASVVGTLICAARSYSFFFMSFWSFHFYCHSVLEPESRSILIPYPPKLRVKPGVTVYGDFCADMRCPIVSLNIGDYDSSEVSDELSVTYGIVTRPGAHCAPLMHRALGTTGQGAVRFSFSHYNTEEEVETAVQAIKELVNDQ